MAASPSDVERFITPGLYLLTAVCGIIGSTTFLALEMVFAEILTGNLMFLAFGIGQGKAVESVNTYAVPLITFSLGAVGGGAALWKPEAGMAEALVVVGVLAFAMGLQNALVLAHAVPDVATNVMTLTLVRLLEPLDRGRQQRPVAVSRCVAGCVLRGCDDCWNPSTTRRVPVRCWGAHRCGIRIHPDPCHWAARLPDRRPDLRPQLPAHGARV